MPSLFIGFQLDDFIARYVYSNLEGAREVYRVLVAGYGLTNGNPADMLWQIEHGYAPWWADLELILAMFRPVSQVTHMLDVRFWPNNAFLMHAHSLLWLAALVCAALRMYRNVLGALIGGLAGLLFAVDHTHGLPVGFISNRHTLIAAAFGALCLERHFRYRSSGDRSAQVVAWMAYLLALLAGESSIAVAGYLVSYAIFVEDGGIVKRASTMAPYVLITLVWRMAYGMAGYGARGSGLYIDPVREPVRFLLAMLERGPILVLGQFLLPPAEAYVVASETFARVILTCAVIFCVAFSITLVPLLRRNRIARFWAAGFCFALIPAGTTYPHNRQLLFASFGAMALVAQLWHLFVVELKGRVLSRRLLFSAGLSALIFGGHLLISPLAMPLATYGVAFAAPLKRGITAVGPEIAGRDAVFITAPDYFSVKLIQLARRVERQPLPRRWRVLSFGPQRVVVYRANERTLEIDYEGGILGSPFMELYRDRRKRMKRGDRVQLQGLSIEVLEVTGDGRMSRARFEFDTPLDEPRFAFYYWVNETFEPFTMPDVGVRRTLPGAPMSWGLK